jgi:hypothetical protein
MRPIIALPSAIILMDALSSKHLATNERDLSLRQHGTYRYLCTSFLVSPLGETKNDVQKVGKYRCEQRV